MALTKHSEITQIIFEPQTGILFVKRRTWVEEDGVKIAPDSIHRDSFIPGQSLDDYESEVQQAANFFWTPDVIAAYRTRQTRQTP